MKSLLIIFCTLFIAGANQAQTVSLDTAANYEGKTITVCSKVAGTFMSKGAKKITYLNLGKPYPNSSFTVVIFEANLANFTYSPAEFLKGKEICVTGKVKMYKGKPEMEVGKEADVKVQ